MEVLNFLKEIHIDPIIAMIIVAGGFFSKTYLKDLTNIGRFKFTDAWKTLLVGSIFITVYIIILSLTNAFPQDMWLEVFYSYIFATSFYELILSPIMASITKKIMGSEVTTTTTITKVVKPENPPIEEEDKEKP
jgi:hypothetical protein